MDIKEAIREAIMSAGAEAVGFAKASRIPDAVAQQYESWIGEGRHAGMDYLRRHAELCIDPRALLEDAATVVSVAFSYVRRGARSGSSCRGVLRLWRGLSRRNPSPPRGGCRDDEKPFWGKLENMRGLSSDCRKILGNGGRDREEGQKRLYNRQELR